MIESNERYAAPQNVAHLLLRDRPVTTDQLKRVASQLGVIRVRLRSRRRLRIALAHQRIEIRKDGSRNQKRIVLVEPGRLVCRAVAQQTNHPFSRVLRPRVRESML